MYSTVAQDSKKIRQALKAKGITNKQVSVKSKSYSMGSSIHVTIKDLSISRKMVEEIANKKESVRRCEVTHEILSGGNQFVFVDYDLELTKKQTYIGKWAIDKVVKYWDLIGKTSRDLTDAFRRSSEYNYHAYTDLPFEQEQALLNAIYSKYFEAIRVKYNLSW